MKPFSRTAVVLCGDTDTLLSTELEECEKKYGIDGVLDYVIDCEKIYWLDKYL